MIPEMVIWWAKANYSKTTIFRMKRKIYKKPYQKAWIQHCLEH